MAMRIRFALLADYVVSKVLSQKPNFYPLNKIMKTIQSSATRRDELIALISGGSTDEEVFNEIKKLNEADANAKKAWNEAIQSIVEMMAKNEPSIRVADLITANPALKPKIESIYSADDFMAGAKIYGFSVTKISNEKVGIRGIPSILKPKNLGMEVLVLKVPRAKGQPTTIFQHSPLPGDTTDKNKLKNAFVYIKGLEGDISLNLRKYANGQPKVQDFLSSAEGDQFISKWAGWISRGGKRK